MGGFGFLDILIFGGVALFLIFRLGNVLGKRTGHQEPPPADPFGISRDAEKADQDDDTVVQLPRGNRGSEDQIPGHESDRAEGPLDAGLTQITVADPSFESGEFLNGAKIAFEMILGAYSQGDEDTLRNLLDDSVLDPFLAAIADRADKGHRLEEVLIGIDGADILEAKMEGTTALVTVKFVSQQAHALYDADGQVIDGDPNKITSVTDIWAFSRDTRSRDPNWLLAATRSSN